MRETIVVDKTVYADYAAKALKYDTLVDAILREKYEYYENVLDYPDNFEVYCKAGIVDFQETDE